MTHTLSAEKKKYYKEMLTTFPCAAFVSLDDRKAGSIVIVCANEQYYELTGIKTGSIEDGTHEILNLEDIATEDQMRVNREFGLAVENSSNVAMDASIRLKDNGYMRCRIHARPLELIGDAVAFVVTLHRYDDKHPEKIIQKHYVEHDSLTNIFNMKGFCQQTAEVLATYPERRFQIFVSDIDSFKTINNMFGEEVGDTILKKFASILKASFARLFKSNVPGSYGRIGSDRFAMCLPIGFVSPEKVVKLVDDMIMTMDLNYRVLVHYGICDIPNNNFNITDIIEQAYLACSTIKHNMIIRYAYYDHRLRKTLLEEQELVAQAEKALSMGEFVPYFQPVFMSDSKMLMSAEALVRWNHHEKGLLTPDRFVPVMERNGFISRLDKAMWEAVLSFLHERIKAGKKIVPISVNMSRQDIYNPRLTEELKELLEKYEVDPMYLHIEVTETAYIEEELQHQLAKTIHSLRQNGFVVLMDDFGSGYSSLNVLKDMPVDIMKIDRGLTVDIESSDRGKEMLSSIIRLANRLSIPTIAEGVENETQYGFLKDIGCDSIQGFYFSRPVPMDEFAKLLDDSEVSEYQKGESMPGQLAGKRAGKDSSGKKLVFIGDDHGEDIAADLFKSNYEIVHSPDPDKAVEDIKADGSVSYVLLTRDAFDRLVGEKA